jgi:hypothetical protein
MKARQARGTHACLNPWVYAQIILYIYNIKCFKIYIYNLSKLNNLVSIIKVMLV